MIIKHTHTHTRDHNICKYDEENEETESKKACTVLHLSAGASVHLSSQL